MPTPQIQNDPIYSLPFLYKYGLIISNDATTPNTVLDISAGQTRDSNNVIDMGVGTLFPPLDGVADTAPLLLNAAVNGVNGLDTGSLAANSLYAIYLIGDSRYYQPVAALATLASNSIPLMPYQYDSYRLIGYAATDGSSHFLKGTFSGTGNVLTFTYDTPIATAVTAGHATTYTAVSLAAGVPPINNVLANIYYSYVPATAGNALSLQPLNGTGASTVITGQVATVAVTGNVFVPAQLTAGGVPEINYKETNASDSVALSIAGYVISL